MEENTTPQNEGQPTADQLHSAPEQDAQQAPEVATSGAPSPTDGAPGTVEDNEYEAEQREHLERRTEPQLPDPNENATAQAADQPQQGTDQPQQS